MACGRSCGHCRNVCLPMCNTLRYVSKANSGRRNGRSRSCVDTRCPRALLFTAQQHKGFLKVAVSDTSEFRRASPSADTSSRRNRCVPRLYSSGAAVLLTSAVARDTENHREAVQHDGFSSFIAAYHRDRPPGMHAEHLKPMQTLEE